MSSKRSSLEIYIDILKTVKQVHKPTRIMYKSNLAWIPMTQYLAFLVENDLVTETEKAGKREYNLTEKGRRALEYIDKIAAEVPLFPTP